MDNPNALPGAAGTLGRGDRTPARRRPPSDPARWILLITSVAALLVTLDALVVTTALSAIRISLQASAEQLEWTVSAYLVAFAALLLTASALGDRYGRRRMFSAGLWIFAIASVGCALAPDVNWLIAARAVQGVGAALVMPLALALLGGAFPPERRARALGTFTGVVGVAVPLGPVLGGAVVNGLTWPWIFWINPPVCVALIVLARLRMRENPRIPTRLDPVGLILVTAGSATAVWALVRGNAAGWTSTEILATGLAGIALLIGFVGWESRAPEPALPVGLFRDRSFFAGNAGVFLLWGSVLGALFFMAQYFQTVLHFGPLKVGLALIPWGALTVVIPRIVGGLTNRVGARPFATAGTVLHGAALAWIAAAAHAGYGYAAMVPALVLSGAGVAMAVPATQAAVLAAVPPPQIGKAAGAYSALRQLGGAFGLAVAVAAFTAAGGYDTITTFTAGFVPAMATCAALGVIGGPVTAAIRGRRRGPAGADARPEQVPAQS